MTYEPKIIRQPGTLGELEEAAKRESFSRKGAEAIIENFAKRRNMTYQEAAKELGYKNAAPIPSMIGRGVLDSDGDGGVTDESVKRYAARKGFSITEEPVNPVGMTDEIFDGIPDDKVVAVTAGMLRQMAKMIRAEERANMTPIDLEFMLNIAGVIDHDNR